MLLMFGLYVLTTLLEIMLVYILPKQPSRNGWVLTISVLSIVSLGWLAGVRWTVWGIVALLGVYRLINIRRVAVGRLPDPRLRRLAPLSLWWIVGLQIACGGLGWWLSESPGMRWLALAALIGLQLVVGLGLAWSARRTWRRTRFPRNNPSLNDHELPSLSVLVPARNETDDLEAILTTLVASDYPKLEIIVLDDCSVTRRTPEILRMFAHDGVRFVSGEPPDEVNWLAKNQAYHRLMAEASGELLLFCGVDMRFERQTLRRLVEALLARRKTMISLLPFRAASAQATASLIQPMRYFWELGLPRRRLNRPPVLSSCWLIRAAALKSLGGFAAVNRKIVPEAYFARQLVKDDGYGFWRSYAGLGLLSTKTVAEQQATAIRTRYPQLHRRLELVIILALLELGLFIGPLVSLMLIWVLQPAWAVWYAATALLTYLFLLSAYYRVAVRSHLNSAWLAWLLWPFAVATDIGLTHLSMWRYEFTRVDWKGRNVCIPVMLQRDASKPATSDWE